MPPPSHSVRAQTLHTELALYRAELLASTTSSPMGTTPANSDEVDDASLERRAKAVLNEHIRMLHEYNEVKDAVEALVERYSTVTGRKAREVLEEIGIERGDR